MRNITKEVIIEASHGNMAAFEEIYQAASGFVYNVALRVAGNREDAKEITQDVFFKLYKSLRNFRFKSSFKTWVYRITTNTAINSAKRACKQRNRTLSYDEEKALKQEIESARNRADSNIDRERTKRLLESLNPDQRACIVLRGIEGLSYQEIAEVLNININTVRSRIKRAREVLMRPFSGGGENNEV